MNFIEKTGKTPELAIQAALEELKVGRDEVETETLEIGSKGLLGIGAKPALVRVTIKHEPEKAAVAFIKEMGAAMGILIDVDVKVTEKQLYITLSGEHMGILIGKRGQTLDALQYLVSLAVNKGTAPYFNIILDAEDYRKRRKESLERLAVSIARKVKATKKSITLEPMSTYERRIIHAVLQSERGVFTHSEGSEPYRNIVVAPKKSSHSKNNQNS